MPITPSAVRVVRRACSFTYGAETVNLEYYPIAVGGDVVTTLSDLMTRANAAETDEEEAKALLELGAWLGTVIASWDYLEDDNETMQPLTAENLSYQVQHFTDFMRAVVGAIMEDRNRGNAHGTLSSGSFAATSSPTAPSASKGASLNPSISSLLPDGSRERLPLNGSSAIPNGTSGRKSAK